MPYYRGANKASWVEGGVHLDNNRANNLDTNLDKNHYNNHYNHVDNTDYTDDTDEQI